MKKEKNNVLRLSGLLLSVLLLAQLTACRTSEFNEIFSSCAPDCLVFESPVSVDETKNAFEQVIDTLVVSKEDLTGRWVMLSASRFQIDDEDEKSVSDLLFSKSMIFNEADGSVTVSDCHQEESYPLSEGSFTIPKDSVFFSSLYFENDKNIKVTITNNARLDAVWELTTLQGAQVKLDVRMYKVSDNSLITTKIGELEIPAAASLDINCYSHLHLFSAGEKKISEQWISFDVEVKELLLKLNNIDDANVALGFSTVEGEDDYVLAFNQGIEDQEYGCFGFSAYKPTQDLLSFTGSFTIDTADIDCASKSLGEYPFSFSAI